MTGVKLEIQDTGLDSIGGSEVYSKAGTGYLNLYATTMRPEFDAVGTNHESARLEGGVRKAASNEIISNLPTRITIQGLYQLSDINDFGTILEMQRTLGLKQLKGGLGILGVMPGSQVDDSVYVIIRSIKPTEVINDSISTIGYTMQLEVVEE